jgi:hypothetical protein
MGLLQYTSNEMFSSTELVRKSKNIFDKLNKNEIEKAIVLRDGKPGIILLDFNYYEQIMAEYLSLKGEKTDISIQKNRVEKIEKKVIERTSQKIDEEIKKVIESTSKEKDEFEFSFDTDLAIEKDEPLKEFWDK